ncbi:predicted protein [Uncinocarpus reesii 1704]|uniref:DNA (cytosine-5-)-methyltransferase n=1 Tax=Uncinocarpus reesii (strain UAMH 1704) TaxID=336963 RepID=C4JSM6_UNCRE|nr:uncharacterized protein UREG_05465 [Uncinocarpus reesii 1704]EEP80623.1 predicted protein [Uncinocarpus reesii 1704]
MSSLSPTSPGDEEPQHCNLLGVVIPRPTVNASAFEGFEPPGPEFTEQHAINKLKRDFSCVDTYGGSGFTSFLLEDFTVYTDKATSRERYGMVSLDNVATKQGNAVFYFDGILKPTEAETPTFYLRHIPFSLVSIGVYEDVDAHEVGEDLWIQSTYCHERDKGWIWYRLGKPSREYKAYHDSFTWAANLAKHLVDYMQHEHAVLADFKVRFHDWLWERHHLDSSFRSWVKDYGKSDFRQAIVAYGPFLYGQAANVRPEYGAHTLWDELGLSATPIVPEQPSHTKFTIVTPYVQKCFEKMPWGSYLRALEIDPSIAAKRHALLHRMGLTPTKRKIAPRSKYPIAPGDIVAIQKDNESGWKGTDNLCLQILFARTLHTPITMNFSIRPLQLWVIGRIGVAEGVKKVSVTFFSDKAANTDFFVRQTYHSVDETFMTLQKSDFQCQCVKARDGSLKEKETYNPGDTVLVETSEFLEPAEIIDFQGNEVKVRVLPRRARDFGGNYRPNELVYTERFRLVHFEQIKRHCYIRFYSEQQRDSNTIPAPYNRDGNGGAFYITCRESSTQGLCPMDPPPNFSHGFDPLEPKRRLRALNLFSGGGSFDRGLEEGTAIRSEWAVEWGLDQMLTYRANHESSHDLKLFRGSVNDYLALALKGDKSDLIAKLGQVEFISGGSPCQGYSLANPQKWSEMSLRNSSMIASVVAYVDFYRPHYAILENVPAMASKTHKRNPLSQLICAFVGMGYQLRLMHLDAWSYGAPQSRSRLFLLIAAPGLELPDHPPLTHSHPKNTTLRSLGEAPNGLPFGERRWDTPIFKFVSSLEGTRDLPDLQRAKVRSIPWPDHRSSRTEAHYTQAIIDQIPKYPRAMGLPDAMAKGYLNYDPYPNEGLRRKTASSRAWSRVNPHLLIPTITTNISPSCKFTGRWLHWRENRLLTVMEARRAQGYPDSEVLVGRASSQWKIVGNSVARQVALALGLSIREACLHNPPPPPPYEQILNDVVEPARTSTNKKRKRRLSEIVVKTTTTVVKTTTRYRFEEELSRG